VAEARPITPGLFIIGPDGPRLVAGHCPRCGKLHFPAGSTCPYCAAAGCSERPVGPSGTLYLYTVVTNRPPGYRGEVPYGFGVVELDDGLRVIGRLGEAHLERLQRAQRVRLHIEPLFTDEDGSPVLSYLFTPESR